MVSKGLKITFVVCVFGAILVALIGGLKTFQDVPPYPGKIVTASGDVLADRGTIFAGQAVFQRYGLMDLGSVWGHGTYRGTEFTAATLHQIGEEMRNFYADQEGTTYEALSSEQKAAIDRRVIDEIKTNNYDAATDTLTFSAAQAYAFGQVTAHYDQAFSVGQKEANIIPNMIKSQEDRINLGKFFYWTAWASGTIRPGTTMTYTNNWPPDESVGNTLAPSAALWTLVSIIAFLAFLATMIVVFHVCGFHGKEEGERDATAADRLANAPVTKSQLKAVKYFVVVAALFLVQTLFGGLMAHYTVHPGEFYVDGVANAIPYNWAKSWHLQLPIFWIALSWMGATIYLAPILGRREPKLQGLLVDVLFVAALVVAVGSLVGEVLGIKGMLGNMWFWLGHQGWEYLELGRLWQILLFVGLGLWLVIVLRGMAPTFARGKDRWGLPHFLAYSGLAVVGFFSFGLFYNPNTHLTIADFWRWWVVHTWVEGAFEFFAVAAIAMATVILGLAKMKDALRAAYLVAALALASGIIGVGHHYYWFGAPSFWFALGGVISALEPVPILLLLGKSWQEYRSIKQAGRHFPYTWPLMFITASGVWAFIGAGLFGFLITTPMVNYYEHSTYLTLNHGHTALFGTYGMLAIGLMLFSLRGMTKARGWKNGLFAISWFGTNIGLALMAFGTLLPVGLKQFVDSFQNGLWHARSPEFYADPVVKFLGQVRIVPDTIIIVLGVLPLMLGVLYAAFNLKRANPEADGYFADLLPDDEDEGEPELEPVMSV